MAQQNDQHTDADDEKTALIAPMTVSPQCDDKKNNVLDSRINSDALQGLRGLAALHVMVFHAFLFNSTIPLNLIGSFQMPLFFLLSGYSLALGYGRTTYTTHSRCCFAGTTVAEDGSPVIFKSFNFYRNRFARIMPVYYLSNFIFGLVPHLFAFGTAPYHDTFNVVAVSLAVLESVVPICMFFPVIFFPFALPGWTISTLWFFYLIFPVLFPYLQRFSNEKRSKWIVILFWVQLFVGIVLSVGLSSVPLPALPGYGPNDPAGTTVGISAYWASTGWGLSRLPVFIMGVLAGMRRLQHTSNCKILQQNQIITLIEAWTPMRTKQTFHLEISTQNWATLLNVNSTIHVLVITTAALLGIITSYFPYIQYINWGIQFIAVHSLLLTIDGLTRDEGGSVVSKICRFRMTQELGRASMTLYLIHLPLMKWVGYAIKKWRNEAIEIQEMKIQSMFHIPLWSNLVVVLVCPIIAWVITKWFEEPLRKKLRST